MIGSTYAINERRGCKGLHGFEGSPKHIACVFCGLTKGYRDLRNFTKVHSRTKPCKSQQGPLQAPVGATMITAASNKCHVRVEGKLYFRFLYHVPKV